MFRRIFVPLDSTSGAERAIPVAAHLARVDLIVRCRHQEAGIGRWGRESIAQQMMRRNSVSLLILPEHGPLLRPIRSLHIIVPWMVRCDRSKQISLQAKELVEV